MTDVGRYLVPEILWIYTDQAPPFPLHIHHNGIVCTQQFKRAQGPVADATDQVRRAPSEDKDDPVKN